MSEVKLVPARMLLDKETIGAINFHCGDGGDNFGEHSEGLLWIGAVTDDEGKEVYGLHLATAEYPEEGSTTLVEFAEPLDAQRLRADTAEAERDALRTSKEAVEFNLNKVDRALLAAEQRNAILGEEVTSLTTRLNERDKLIEHIGSMIAKACSPNQKPEGESHE